MLIDWFTVIAQALNFLILVWLMKHFLYKPILNAIDTREKRIATELALADKKRNDAQKMSDEFNHKTKEFDLTRTSLLQKVTDEAQTERTRLLGEAKKAADALTLKRMESMQNEEKTLQQAISRKTQTEVFSIARKALTDLASANLEDQVIQVFNQKLIDLGSEEKEKLVSSLKKKPGPIMVRTSINLSPSSRTSTENTIKNVFGADAKIQFETSPNLISGIELTTNGQKLAWSIASYLGALEKNVDELLKGKPKPENIKPETKGK